MVAQGPQRLLFHASLEAGAFLNMLRPYHGLSDEVLVDVLDALKDSARDFGNESIARGLASAVWTISYLGRLWTLAPDSMLRRNGLISDEDLQKFAAFFERFDYAVMTLLEQGDVEEAFFGLGAH
jgi:hypothetical protein